MNRQLKSELGEGLTEFLLAVIVQESRRSASVVGLVCGSDGQDTPIMQGAAPMPTGIRMEKQSAGPTECGYNHESGELSSEATQDEA